MVRDATQGLRWGYEERPTSKHSVAVLIWGPEPRGGVCSSRIMGRRADAAAADERQDVVTGHPGDATSDGPMHVDDQAMPIDRLLNPFGEVAAHTLAGAGLLLAATAIALVWANSPLAASYHALFETPVAVSAGPLAPGVRRIV
jgi:hypothetical protein